MYYVGIIGNEPVCHMAVSPLFTSNAYRGTRLVVMPEWQGAGVGMKFLNAIGDYHLQGFGRCGHKYPMFFHTSHPQLCGALRASKYWIQTNAKLYGDNKARSANSIKKSHEKSGTTDRCASGYGGHFRAVQAFKYVGGQTV